MNLTKNKIILTSLEIAELTAKRHDNVIRDIEEQLIELGGLLNFEDTYINPQNKQEYKMYRLPKRECLILISGYSIKLRASIIDRLQFLEDELKTPLVAQSTIQVNISNQRWRKAFYLGYEGRCFFTGKPLKENAFHIDHLVPKSKEGQDTLENLVLSSPAINQSKSDSYSAVWSERAINDVKEVFGPAVLKHYHKLGEELISKAFESNPQFCNPKFIDKLEELFGREHVRSLYASLIPGLNADVREIAYDKGIGEFLNECTLKDMEDFITVVVTFETYLSWAKENSISPAGKSTFLKYVQEEHGVVISRRTTIVDGSKKSVNVFNNLKLVG